MGLGFLRSLTNGLRGVSRKRGGSREPRLAYKIGDVAARAHPSWYRGENVNYHPRRANLSEPDAVDRYVVRGWAPPKPFITRANYITPFGSCFAQHVAKYLLAQGYDVFGHDIRPDDAYVIRCGEGMVNSAVVAQQFQWAYGEIEFDETLWHDREGNPATYLEDVRLRTREIFDRTDVFIITLGLSEVWYSTETGSVFWRSIPLADFDPRRHGFKVMTVAENRANLDTIHRIVRSRRPQSSIIVTLSPIPLTATFRPVSCITANSVSKASLRVAIDEFIRANGSDSLLFYFPSFEIAKDFCRVDPYEDDLRHIKPATIALIMDAFHRNYLV